MPFPYMLQKPRTDREIVEDTNHLARFVLATLGTGYEAPAGWKFYEAEDPRSKRAWQRACEIMEEMTATDPNDALSSVDPDEVRAQQVFDTDNRLINTFAEKLVAVVAELPAHAIADTPQKGIEIGDAIQAIRIEAAKPEYQQNSHARRFYDLSTAHVSPAARHWLEANAWENANGKEACRVAAFATGWVMWVPEPEREEGDHKLFMPEHIHADLHPACFEAWAAGCAYIMFDVDASESDTLPIYEEDETTTAGLTDEEKAALDIMAKDIAALPLTITVRDDETGGRRPIHPEDGRPLDDGWEEREAEIARGGNIDDYLGRCLKEPAPAELPKSPQSHFFVPNHGIYLTAKGITELLTSAKVDPGLIEIIGGRLAEGAWARFELRRLKAAKDG